MTPTETLALADAARVTLPLAMLSACDDATRWLAINATATTLLGALRGVSANPDLRRELRDLADALADSLHPIQRRSCAEYERIENLAA